jgi:malonyl-CoA/methylmalonyl-CoA synthetase
VVGVLVARPEAKIDVDALEAAMAKSLARFKQPKHLAIVAELPRNTMGKVQKNLLRQEFAALFR